MEYLSIGLTPKNFSVRISNVLKLLFLGFIEVPISKELELSLLKALKEKHEN